MKAPLYEIPVRKIDGTETTLGEFQGKALLIVNVASKCGLTPQYEGLEKIYERFQGKGFEVLGFPANEFLAQEPGTNEEIQQFCRGTFGVRFPMFQKIVVKGQGQHPLYRYLTQTRPTAQGKPGSEFKKKLEGHGIRQENPSDILWNFEKFLVNKKGEVVGRFAPDVTPDDPMIIEAIGQVIESWH